ncbi:DUF4255 domain-containing protein [Motilibacter deserti]|uniref:DUF4255 domain-containing protein n=1 Tax=Motilibacter deserti TaxID=2714956 RepID=A0ABX0GVZ6_9ACTN|nr:DUF4255 domain-containing protein [Motilibacter deserti]
MIQDVDESLRAMIRQELSDDSQIDVVFDAPTTDWAARRNAPTVDVYLYDVREDLRRRQVGIVDLAGQVSDVRRTVARRQPPRFFKLSYLLTAWTQRPEDEHRLLSSMLHCFLRHDHVPLELMTGSLQGSGVPLGLTLAIPPPEDRALSDVWSALGGELKPSLDLVVIVPVDLDRTAAAAPPVTEPPQVSLSQGVAAAGPRTSDLSERVREARLRRRRESPGTVPRR